MPLLGIFHAKQNTSDNSDTNIRQHNKNNTKTLVKKLKLQKSYHSLSKFDQSFT